MKLIKLISALGFFVAVSASAANVTMEQQTDRFGRDYRNIVMGDDARPGDCANACLNDWNCRAYTFVFAGYQGRPHPTCHLKNGVPAPSYNRDCVSGVKY